MRLVHRYPDKLSNDYQPSCFDSNGSGFLNERHADLVAMLEPVYGWLQPGDHYKLYEMAYFSEGPVLEIGRLHAKSTIIIASALRDANRPGPFWSVDVSEENVGPARENIERFGVGDLVEVVQGDSVEAIEHLPGPFDTVFIDGDHSFEGVTRDLRALIGKVRPGGIVMFHDCFDPRNLNPDEPTYGVGPAVDALKDEAGLAFVGRFGAIGMFEQT